MTKYEVAEIDGHLWVVTKDALRGGYVGVYKLPVYSGPRPRFVKRGDHFYNSKLKVGKFSFIFNEEEDDNFMTVDDGPTVKVTWKQVQQFIGDGKPLTYG
jgi:hypothetical protein